MNRFLLAAALLLGTAASVSALPPAATARVQRPGTIDPRAFVSDVYARYAAHPDSPPADLRYVYSPRLARLFAAYDAWGRAHPGDVGALDFDWWTNSQDYRISHVVAVPRDEGPGRRSVTARFDNLGHADAVTFHFVNRDRRWYLDEVVHGSGRGANGWTLSVLLAQRE